jgi:NADH-quinone oxidoreductase subunit L
MRVPMAILAAASCWLFFSWNPFDFSGWIFDSLHQGENHHSWFMPIASAAWVVLASSIAYFTRERSVKSTLLLNGFYINQIYRFIFELPTYQLALLTERTDKRWIDGILHASAYLQLLTAHVVGWFDRVIIDGLVDGSASLARVIGSFVRSFQSGKIQLYIFWAVFAIIIFIIWTLL